MSSVSSPIIAKKLASLTRIEISRNMQHRASNNNYLIVLRSIVKTGTDSIINSII